MPENRPEPAELKKKLIALFLCLCLMAGIVPVMAESTAKAHEITSSEFPFYANAEEMDSMKEHSMHFQSHFKVSVHNRTVR